MSNLRRIPLRRQQNAIVSENAAVTVGVGCGPCPPTPNPCGPSIRQRVTCLESEVDTLSYNQIQQDYVLENHEVRITNLEKTVCGSCGYNPCCCKKQNNSCTNNCDLSPGRRPPIIFDGYIACAKVVVIGGVNMCFWFLIPENTAHVNVYRFSWNSTSNKYIYEPVHPDDYSVVYPPSLTDNLHITYYYDNISDYGWGLRPYIYLSQSSAPHTILGYQYIPIIIVPTVTEWCYVPLNSPLDPPIFTPYNRKISFQYAKTSLLIGPTTYYNVVNSTIIDPNTNVTKYPISITDLEVGSTVTQNIVPIITGVAFELPFDSFTYQVSFIPEVKISTELATTNSINYLSGSGLLGSQPAVAQLEVHQLDNNGVVIDRNLSARTLVTWANISIDPLLPAVPPNNFRKYQDATIPGAPGEYYKTLITTSSPIYNILPILDSNNKPYGRRLVTFAVTAGFSVSSVTATIVRMNL
jgi:hypothetical protein